MRCEEKNECRIMSNSAMKKWKKFPKNYRQKNIKVIEY